MYACRSLNATRRLTIGGRETRVPRLIACHSLIELEDTQHKIWAQIHRVSQIAAQMMVVEVEESAEERARSRSFAFNTDASVTCQPLEFSPNHGDNNNKISIIYCILVYVCCTEDCLHDMKIGSARLAKL